MIFSLLQNIFSVYRLWVFPWINILHLSSWLRRHVRQVLLWHWWMNYHEFKWKSTDWSDAPLIALLRSREMERRNKLNIYCWFNLRSHECILLTADSVKTHNHILHMQSHYENPPWSKVFISLIFLPCWPTQEYTPDLWFTSSFLIYM